MQPPQQPKPHPGLFHRNAPQQPDFKALQGDIGNISRRLRVLEESFTNIRRALQVTEQNMLGKNKVFATEIRTLTSDIGDMKNGINEVKEKILEMVKELEESAKKEEVKVLEKYINFWNPVKFVTQNEVEAIVKEILKKEKTKNK
tara:strand:- start:41474 stop:41908 length:435 start_codon:yes stop_codon:yes gene_type:complete